MHCSVPTSTPAPRSDVAVDDLERARPRLPQRGARATDPGAGAPAPCGPVDPVVRIWTSRHAPPGRADAQPGGTRRRSERPQVRLRRADLLPAFPGDGVRAV